MRARSGSVVLDRRRGTWSLYFYDSDGKHRSRLIGTKRQYPSKRLAERAAEAFANPAPPPDAGPRVRDVLKAYMRERMPKRHSTRLAYKSWTRNHILPRWGGRHHLNELQPRPVQLWLDGLTTLTPKSRSHIKGILGNLWSFAMYAGWTPIMANPMSLVTVPGATKRKRHPRSLTVAEFQLIIAELDEHPIVKVIAIVSGCLGLRISETLGLRWGDLDVVRGRIKVERGIVRQVTDSVKTDYSERPMPVDPALLEVLLAWKLKSEFSEAGDWIFASPVKLGRLPVSYPGVWKAFQNAADRAGIARFGVHTLRHSYRSWLDEVGTELAVQQTLMRHVDIRTTMKYGDVQSARESEALAKLAALTLNKQHATARSVN